MLNMSFSYTTTQFCEDLKDITRRMGWLRLQPGDKFMAIEKGMGLKKGEKVVRLGECVCVSNTREPLNAITQDDVNREGFPNWTPAQFIAFFCKANKCKSDQIVSRIVFERLKT